MSDSNTDFPLYNYTPSLVAAAVFSAIFFVSSAALAWRTFKTRSWYFSAMIIVTVEGVGYIGRILSHNDPEALGPYVMQTLLLLVAPSLFAVAIYVVLGRLIRMLHAEHYSLIPLKWLTKFFVLGEVISFILQSGGGGIMAGSKDQDKIKIGQYVIVVGLILQMIWLAGFAVVAGVFHCRMRVIPAVPGKANWRRFMFALYGASNMILSRSMFRVIEFVQGRDGFFMQSERWIYLTDGLLMAEVLAAFVYFHPSAYIRGDEQYTMGEHEELSMHARDEEHANTVSMHPYSGLGSGR
ncbi:RTA1 like protein-domain-containing protein [Desarmillaria tabescens]|uniref:RTA1 like protein-domain-containing protein n=1 Tax=Armillaria tabescens TaxID=1929756 RepID=A0AA39JUW8_ARMTA|nr:RTA1 like protein-domain-containing protein [Desarmillaria tabescens]KAK0448335.1 RTA1 like protein-domain-containing protein [Desarmillaria tabescens]